MRILVVLLLIASIGSGPLNRAMKHDLSEDYRAQYELNRGQVHARLQEYEVALKHFSIADRLMPGRSPVLAAVANTYLQMNRLDEAAEAVRRLRALDPDSSASFVVLGWVHARRGDWSDALEEFAAGLAQDPGDPELNLGMWLAHANTGQSDEGVQYLTRAVEVDPNNALAAAEYGVWLAERGRLDEAERFLLGAHHLAPNQPEILFNLATVHSKAGRNQQAVDLLKKALRIDPAYEKARRVLNMLTATPGSNSVSIEALREQISKNPGDARPSSKLAGILHGRGDAAEAVRVLRDAVSKADEVASVSMELAWLLATSPEQAIRDGAEALRLAEHVLAELPHPPPEYLDVLAAALAETGQFERAAKQAGRAADLAAQRKRHDLERGIRRRTKLYESGQPFQRH